eukprot:818362_1
MAQLMDVLFDIKNKKIKDIEAFTRNFGCQSAQQCNILNNNTDRRRQRTIRPKHAYYYKDIGGDNNMSLEDCNTMEMLDVIHMKVFHPQNSDQRIEDRKAKDILDEEVESNHLFKDRLDYDIDLRPFKLFCDVNEYDSEALYHDMFLRQSNVYAFFKNNDTMDKLDLLKDDVSIYVAKPLDEDAQGRRLTQLDFGHHVTDWNVTPKFYNIKQEWTENEYAPISLELCKSLYMQSQTIAKTNKNRASYNLSAHDILCIKTYTDTTNLQAQFRHAFRTSSDKNRRSQFIHWATHLNITFIKIEVGNEVHQHNEFISNHTLYHGLNRLFDTKQLRRQFNGPLSTSWDIEIAIRFAGDHGMVLQIDKGVNNKNSNAMTVDWISCHDNENEALLLNPIVVVQKSYVYAKDVNLTSSYLKQVIISTINDQQTDCFRNLSSFFKAVWIVRCLEDVVKDQSFVERMKLFEPKSCLQGMSLFELIFFEGHHYQIAKYVIANGYYDECQVRDMLIGTDHDFVVNDIDGWIQSVDRSQKLCTKYQPRMCKMNIIYQYGENDKIEKPFGTKQGKAMLMDTNLILQYIDQRKIHKLQNDLVLNIDMNIKYQVVDHDGVNEFRCGERLWRCKLSIAAFNIGTDFRWKIGRSTILTNHVLYVSSLWICKSSRLRCDDSIGYLKAICAAGDILIDENSSIDMNESGVNEHSFILCNELNITNGSKITSKRRITIVTNNTNIDEKDDENDGNQDEDENALVQFGYIEKYNEISGNFVFKYDDNFSSNEVGNVPFTFDCIDKIDFLNCKEEAKHNPDSSKAKGCEEEEDEQKYPKHIELKIKQTNTNDKYSNIELRVGLNGKHGQTTLKLNDSKTKILINRNDKLSHFIITNEDEKRMDLASYYKHRSECLMNHRLRRNNIMFMPICILFLVFLIVTAQLVHERRNKERTPYINNNKNNYFRTSVSLSELEQIKQCDVPFDNIYGYFDARSFLFGNDSENTTWFDYSRSANHMEARDKDVKLGLFSDWNDSFYIYGDKSVSIDVPSSLDLDKNNYTIISIARYNGNDRDTIFVSKTDDKEWIFGFQNASENIIYHDGIALTVNASSSHKKAMHEWVINVDSTHVFRSQHETLYENANTSNPSHEDANVIKWGINMFKSSDWAIAAIIVFNQQLSVPQIECIETMLVNQYHINTTHHNDGNNHTAVDHPTIYECNRWTALYYDDILAWYDANSGFENDVLIDLSQKQNNIDLNESNINIGLEANKGFKYLYGSTNDSIDIPLNIDNSDAVVIHYVARYNGNDKGSILTDIATGFLCGFNDGNAGVCYWNEQRLSQFEADVYGNQWVLSSFFREDDTNNWFCTQNCDTSFYIDYDSSDLGLRLTINGEYNSEWALAELIIATPSSYSDAMCFEEYLSNKYDIDSYKYDTKTILLLQLCNSAVIIAIIIGGWYAGHFILIGFCNKCGTDTALQFVQFLELAFTSCCCKYNLNCCCGAFKGICGRHACACQCSVLPFYNVSSIFLLIKSIINRIQYSRTEANVYLTINTLCITLATVIHFVFVFDYIIGDTVDYQTVFYFIELEICVFVWCIAMVDGFRNYTNDWYWLIVLCLYANISFIVSITYKVLHDQWSVDEAMIILALVELTLICLSFVICSILRHYINLWAHCLRCIALIVAIVIFAVVEWNDYRLKQWLFVLILTTFFSLYLGDYMLPNATIFASAIKNDIFQAMIRNTKYNPYVPLIDAHADCSLRCLNGKRSPIFNALLGESTGNTKEENFTKNVFDMDVKWANDLRYDQIMRLYENNGLILPRDTDYNDSKYITLHHEYEANGKYEFDGNLLQLLYEEAHCYDSDALFIEDVMALVIFVKFASFRMLFYDDLLNETSHFVHFYRKLNYIQNIYSSIPDLETSTKGQIGYTILNSQISNKAPIIFGESINAMMRFATTTNNNYHGIVFRIKVCGSFIPLSSLFGDLFDGIFVVLAPEYIEMIPKDYEYNDDDMKMFSFMDEKREAIDGECNSIVLRTVIEDLSKINEIFVDNHSPEPTISLSSNTNM